MTHTDEPKLAPASLHSLDKVLPPLPLGADLGGPGGFRKIRVRDFGFESSASLKANSQSMPFGMKSSASPSGGENLVKTTNSPAITCQSPSSLLDDRITVSPTAVDDHNHTAPPSPSMSSFVSLSLSRFSSSASARSSTSPSTPRPHLVPLNDTLHSASSSSSTWKSSSRTRLTALFGSSSNMSSTTSFAPLSAPLPSATQSHAYANEWGVSTTPLSASTSANITRKKSTSKLVSNLGKSLTRVGSVMRRNTSESALSTKNSLGLSVSTTPGSRRPVDETEVVSASRRGWIQRRMRSATMPQLTADGLVEEDAPRRDIDIENEDAREKEWEVSTQRLHGDADEGDEDITRPFNVKHNLHISQDLSDLPPAWLATLRAQGLSETDLLLLNAAKKDASQRTRANLVPIQTTASSSISFAVPEPSRKSFTMQLPSPIGYNRRKSSVTPKYDSSLAAALESRAQNDAVGEMRESGTMGRHDRRPSFFERFSFEDERDSVLHEEDESEESAAAPELSPSRSTPPASSILATPQSSAAALHTHEGHPFTSPQAFAPPYGYNTKQEPDSSQGSRGKPSTPPTPTRSRMTKGPTSTPPVSMSTRSPRKSSSNRHKKRLSEQLRGFKSTLSGLEGGDNWAESLTFALGQGFDSESPKSGKRDLPAVYEGVTGATPETQAEGQLRHTDSIKKSPKIPNGLNLRLGSDSNLDALAAPPVPSKSERTSVDLNGEATPIATGSHQRFDAIIDIPGDYSRYHQSGHARNTSEALGTDESCEVVTPPDLGEASISTPLPINTSRFESQSRPQPEPQSQSQAQTQSRPQSQEVDLKRIGYSSMFSSPSTRIRPPSNIGLVSSAADTAPLLPPGAAPSIPSDNHASHYRNKVLPGTPLRDDASSWQGSPSETHSFQTGYVGPSLPTKSSKDEKKERRYTPLSPSSVGNSRPVSFDPSAFQSDINENNAGVGVGLGLGYIGHQQHYRQPSGGEASVHHVNGKGHVEARDRHSALSGFSMMSSSRGSMGSNSVHEATLQQAYRTNTSGGFGLGSATGMGMGMGMGLGLGPGLDLVDENGENSPIKEEFHDSAYPSRMQSGFGRGDGESEQGSDHGSLRQGPVRGPDAGTGAMGLGVGSQTMQRGASAETNDSDYSSFSALDALNEAARRMALDRPGGRRTLSGMSRFEDAD